MQSLLQNKKLIIAIFIFAGVVILTTASFIVLTSLPKPTTSDKKDTKINYTPLPEPSSTLAPRSFACPTLKTFCQKASSISVNNAYFGIGYTIAENSDVTAMFDGILSSSLLPLPNELGSGTYLAVSVYNQDLALRSTYLINSNTLIDSKKVKRGEKIAKTGSIIPGLMVSLAVQIIRGDPYEGRVLQLSSADFQP